MPTINKGSDYFGVLTYTGDGAASKTVVDTNAVSFTPDFVWIKGRSGATDHALYDAVRGTTKDLVSNSTVAETTQSTGLTAFTNGGFTIGNLAKLNTSGATYTAWCWKANGAGSSNTSGSITSTVSVNTTAGFSIVTYTTTSPFTNATVGHGLGVTPAMIISFLRNAAGDTHFTWHKSLSSTQYLQLQTTAAATTNSVVYNGTSSTTFTLGSNAGWGSGNYVSYCWAEISGFSKAFSYTGNASSDGPFIHLGFRPKFILIKGTASGRNWVLFDSSRNTYNASAALARLKPNTSDAEDGNEQFDFLSNGFKIRNYTFDGNANGETYIGMAFAENPFKNANAR